MLPTQKSEPDERPLSLRQPAWHVIVLSVATLKVYFIYWCYKNWRDLCRQMENKESASPLNETQNAGGLSKNIDESTAQQEQSRPAANIAALFLPGELASFKNASPLLRTIGVLIPYLSNYLFFTLVLGIARLEPDKKSPVSAHPVLCALAIATVSIALSYLAALPNAFYFLFLLSAIPVAIAQHWLNRYWDSVETPGLLMRHGFSFKELLVIIGGALVLGYLVSSFILGANK